MDIIAISERVKKIKYNSFFDPNSALTCIDYFLGNQKIYFFLPSIVITSWALKLYISFVYKLG